MDKLTIAEEAYKNGYEKGLKDAVKHGHWEIVEDDYFDLVNLKCSVCREEWCFEDYDDCLPQNYHYCPNCGAKMDEGM